MEKSLKPVLASDFVAGELGCGHNGFFVDEFGDTFITYHGHKTLGVSDRIDGIRRVHFGADACRICTCQQSRTSPNRSVK